MFHLLCKLDVEVILGLRQCERVVLPLDPAGVGCQRVFALMRPGAAFALGREDQGVVPRLRPASQRRQAHV